MVYWWQSYERLEETEVGGRFSNRCSVSCPVVGFYLSSENSWLMLWWCQSAGRKVTEKINLIASVQVLHNICSEIKTALRTLNILTQIHSTDPYFRLETRVEMKVHCIRTYGNILCGGCWLGEHGPCESVFWRMLFSHYTLKPSGWGSSGRRRKRRDWSRCQCPKNQKVRITCKLKCLPRIKQMSCFKLESLWNI